MRSVIEEVEAKSVKAVVYTILMETLDDATETIGSKGFGAVQVVLERHRDSLRIASTTLVDSSKEVELQSGKTQAFDLSKPVTWIRREFFANFLTWRRFSSSRLHFLYDNGRSLPMLGDNIVGEFPQSLQACRLVVARSREKLIDRCARRNRRNHSVNSGR